MAASIRPVHPAAPSFLHDEGLRLVVFGGKGGAGKTTCATATALHRAALRPDRSVMLVSADPAHSLDDSLAGMPTPPNLTVRELDAQECLAAFRAENWHTLERIAAAGTFLDDQDIRGFLNLSLPGLDELMAFLRISEWVDQGRYDCIVLDTAPSGHALRLLGMARLLRNWLSMLDALLAKTRYLRRVFSRSPAPDDLDRFLSSWWASLKRMARLLRSLVRCRFVPVTVAEALSVRETVSLLAELRRQRIPVSDVVINQLHPAGPCALCRQICARERQHLRWLVSAAGPLSYWTVERFAGEVRGHDPLTAFWDRARPLDATATRAAVTLTALREPVETPAALPPASVQLLLFAGKGGVGKTTLACATALRLAADFPDRRILLLSTDPAHSLAACLDAAIGPSPVPVRAGLSAMEIDAPAELAALKERYVDDVREFLESVSRTFDFTFDRVVLEKMMDLAPPGLDEIMAVARMAEFLRSGAYDLLILDPAATGHFIRLLELPALIDQWLKAMFDFLLKYEQIFQAPGFTDRLVEFSKNLKFFRQLPADPRRAVAYAVSIPAEMARAETVDLLESCRRMGVRVPALFLNLMTPHSDCTWCAAARDRERLAAARYRATFPEQRHVIVYRQELPVGIERLERLGRELFAAHDRELAAAEAGGGV